MTTNHASNASNASATPAIIAIAKGFRAARDVNILYEGKFWDDTAGGTWVGTLQAVADELANTLPHFDRIAFLNAAGYDPSNPEQLFS